MCPFYRTWHSMLQRVYSVSYHKNYPTYKDCTICDDWLTFSKFKAWMEQQDWKDKQLDKDILIPYNKHYSPETCVFVIRQINSFISSNHNGKYKRGVYYRKDIDKFKTTINYQGKTKHLGYFLTEQDAHNAWKKHKIIQYNELINNPDNEYIKSGLIKHRDLLTENEHQYELRINYD